MDEYIPTKIDIEWAKQVVANIYDGKIIGFPSSDLFYRVNHKDKTMSLISGNAADEIHLRTIVVFGKIGDSVITKIEPKNRVIREMLDAISDPHKTTMVDEAGAEKIKHWLTSHERN